MDPITIAAISGGLLRGISSLFGDSEEEKRNKQRRRMLQALKGQQEANNQRAEKDKSSLDRQLSSEKADRRNTLSQKLAQYGYEPGGSIATNEKDIVLANFEGKENVMSRLAEANQLLDKQAAEINAGIEDEPDMFGTFLGEGISGAAEGIKFGQALGFLDPKPAGGGTTPTKYDTPVTAPEINTSGLMQGQNNINLSLFGEGGMGNTMLGQGNAGFEMDPMLSDMPDYSGMMDKYNMGSELAGYKNPFKKNNNVFRLRNR